MCVLVAIVPISIGFVRALVGVVGTITAGAIRYARNMNANILQAPTPIRKSADDRAATVLSRAAIKYALLRQSLP